MADQNLVHIVNYTKTQLGQAHTAETPFTSEQIEDQLSLYRLGLEWILLDRDPDYLNYYCRPTDWLIGHSVKDRLGSTPLYTFDDFMPVRFIAADYQLRNERNVSGTQYTPDVESLGDGRFTFNAAQTNISLYIFGDAHNPYLAAADLLQGGPVGLGLGLRSVRRGNVTQVFELDAKIKNLRALGMRINRKKTTFERG